MADFDLMTRLREDFTSIRGRMQAEFRDMAKGRQRVGPRTRKRLREHILGLPAEEGAATVLKMQEKAKHTDGEKVACPACRFFDEGG